MGTPDLIAFAGAVAAGDIEVIDLTHTLTPEFPTIVMPPELGQCAPFRMEEVSRYDERGPAWYWNNISMGEHTGTHFDAPVHWISGKDLPNGSVDTIPAENFIAPAVVVDISAQSAANPDYELTVADVTAWEERHGRIPPRSWVLLRTDWSKRGGRDYVNMREDGQHTPGPCPEVVRFLVEERDLHGFGTETIGTDAATGAGDDRCMGRGIVVVHARRSADGNAPRGTRASTRSGLPDPRRIFSGAARITEPVGGSRSRLARHCRP